jgi:hypothetical protein
MEIVIIAFAYFVLRDNYDATRYEKAGVEAVEMADLRDCKAAAYLDPHAPSAADSAVPGGMERSAERLEALRDGCMRSKGYRVRA